MDLTKVIAFRTANIVSDRAAALSHDHAVKHSELCRLAFAFGIKNIEQVAATKRDDLTLEEALLLQSIGVDFK